MAGVELFGLNPVYINNFVLLAMAGFFTAIVRAPITGIILLFEMSGSVSQMLSLAVVSVVAYITATLLKSEPIYESLLNRLLDGQKKENESGENSRRQGAGAGRQKVLSEFVIMSGLGPLKTVRSWKSTGRTTVCWWLSSGTVKR